MSIDTKLIGTGLYSLPQAARLVGANPRSVRRWMLGYNRKDRGETRFIEPLWRSQLAGTDLEEPVIGFRDLLELRLVNAFARHGVSLRTIRATANAARAMFETDYPLTMQRFLTDGKRIFSEIVEAEGNVRLLEPARQQYIFTEIVTPSLYAGVEYDGSEARRWYPLGKDNTLVVLDPQIQFGTPIVRSAAVPTDILYASYIAEGRNFSKVASVFDVDRREVEAAVRFEEQLAA
ncbi:DUF433 domain-containing protein [Microvirga tunisiensis]|uniref:DUF433 domain-containing protein n=1 Tax=Pannonibacter tanglangensis TaxID=2750084 RepID=A0A7X5F3F1_9HYPH|nr:DUF433 domain-containing protein [Pannonibacter sp. XCT-53]NBN79070.1 DUF433 domain-containing protein [Pannonibacter sp. XCT-53]